MQAGRAPDNGDSRFRPADALEEKIDAMIKEKQSLADLLFADGGEKLVTEIIRPL